jgi:ferrous iron transport protein B
VNNKHTIALIGNPNSGKTTLFNGLTGGHQKIGNWPGVTVEKKTGKFSHGETRFRIVDLPGTYSLHVSHDDDSIDQQIAQNYILEESPDLLVNIIDASSLQRGLYLTTQLLDTGIPVVIALNMMDVAHQQGIHIDAFKLAQNIGVPVIPIVASKKEGFGAMLDTMVNKLNLNQSTEPSDSWHVNLGEAFESTIDTIRGLIQSSGTEDNRLLATALLERDDNVFSRYTAETQQSINEALVSLEKELGGEAADLLIDARYKWVTEVTKDDVYKDQDHKKTLTDRLDNIFLNRLLAFPIFLAAMYLMFMFTINFGGAFIDVFDITANALFVELPRQLLTAIHTPVWLITFIADGVGSGIQLVASFIPVIGTLFLFQSFLESSGYMARAAFIVDRMMRSIGLPGKSFVPLIVGFGCNVPSVMSARTLDSHNDRLLTTLMAPFMSCGARLTVYILFATVFFPEDGQNVVFALYVLGIVLAVATGFLVKKRLMSKEITPFIMELPNYHIPTLKGILISTWYRLRGFMLRAGKAIVIVVVVLNFVNSIGTDGSFGNENSEKSVLSVIGMKITPIFTPMGVKEDNWPATVGIFSGIFAKEVVVGTLDALYTSIAEQNQQEEPDEEVSISGLIAEGFATIPENLAGLSDMITDPLGLSVGDITDQVSSAEDQDVHLTTFSTMSNLFGSAIAAFAYILFVLLYMPCVATLGAIYKEAGSFWAFFSATWNTVIAYALAVICFQLGTFSSHPQSSILWSLFMVVVTIIGYYGLMAMAKKQIDPQLKNLIPTVNVT